MKLLVEKWEKIRSSGVLTATILMLTGSFVGVIGVAFLAGGIETVLQGFLPDKWLNTISARGIQLGFGLFSVSYFYYNKGREILSIESFRTWIESSLDVKDFAWVIAGFLMMGVSGFVFQEISGLLNLPHGAVGGSIDNQLEATLTLAGASSFLFAFVLPALMEESFYRGVVQERLSEDYNGYVTILVSAFLFGLSHLLFSLLTGNGIAVAFSTLLSTGIGGLFGYVIPYYKTKNLFVVALIHALGWTAFEPVQILISAV